MHSEPITRSPSSFSFTRSTPCVDGCCGPMFRMSSSAPSSVLCSLVVSMLRVVVLPIRLLADDCRSFASPLVLNLESRSRCPLSFFFTCNLELTTYSLLPALNAQVLFHPTGILLDDVVILAQRIPSPLVWQQDARQIGMPGEDNSKHVKRFTLQPIGRGPNARDARNFFAVARAGLYAQPFIF